MPCRPGRSAKEDADNSGMWIPEGNSLVEGINSIIPIFLYMNLSVINSEL
jgi:hypothetical protein